MTVLAPEVAVRRWLAVDLHARHAGLPFARGHARHHAALDDAVDAIAEAGRAVRLHALAAQALVDAGGPREDNKVIVMVIVMVTVIVLVLLIAIVIVIVIVALSALIVVLTGGPLDDAQAACPALLQRAGLRRAAPRGVQPALLYLYLYLSIYLYIYIYI